MADPRVLLLGYDLFSLGYIKQLDNIEEFKTFQRDKLTSNEYIIDVENKDNFFSIDNPASPLSNNNWFFAPIQIYDKRGILIWDAILIDVPRTHGTISAGLKTRSTMSKFQKNNIEYTSSDWETPAQAFKNICDSISFENYNDGAYEKSHGFFVNAGCYIKVRCNEGDKAEFQQVIEKIAELSATDCYNHNNEIYFQHWQEYSGTPNLLIESKDIKRDIEISQDYKQLINQGKLGYSGDGGTPYTDPAAGIGKISRDKYGTQSLPDVTTSEDEDLIQLKDSVSAKYLLEQHMKMTTYRLNTLPRPRTKINFSISYDFERYIDLQSYFRLNLPEENWINKNFEIYKFTLDEFNDNISIEGYEV